MQRPLSDNYENHLSSTTSNPGPRLVRALGTWDVSLITFSTIVGSAIFIAASIVPRAAPDPTFVLLD